MATLNDGDIIRTAVGAAAPPQPHSAKVSNIRRFPVRSTFLQNNKFPYDNWQTDVYLIARWCSAREREKVVMQ